MRTIVHLSDLHFGRIDERLLEPLRRTVENLAPHLVVVSGDLTQRARTREFRQARDYLATLPRPQLVVPGNHDVPLYDVFQRFLRPLRRYRRLIAADLEPAFIDEEIAVLGVSTARSLAFKGGRINEEQVEAVRARLRGLSRRMTRIVVTHHPFDVPEDSDRQHQIVGRARMALQRLAGCGADILLSGHLHAAHVGHTATRYDIAGLSALVVQAGTALSTRSRGHPNGFNVLQVSARHIDVERYAWRDGAFELAATESFDHDSRGWHEPARHDDAA